MRLQHMEMQKELLMRRDKARRIVRLMGESLPAKKWWTKADLNLFFHYPETTEKAVSYAVCHGWIRLSRNKQQVIIYALQD